MKLVRSLKITAIALSLFFSSGGGAQENAPATTPTKPDYNSYLQMLKKKVESNWKLPKGVSGRQSVTIVFVLDMDGNLISAEVADSTDAAVSSAAMEAMHRASPFPRIPEELRNLAGERLKMTFTVFIKPR